VLSKVQHKPPSGNTTAITYQQQLLLPQQPLHAVLIHTSTYHHLDRMLVNQSPANIKYM
jgi:hypothetical protein